MRLAGCSSGRPERRLEDVSKSCSFIEGGYGWEADAAVYTLNCWFGHNRLEESEEKRILKCLMLYFRSSFQSAGVDVRSLVAGIGITCFQQRLHFKYEDEILLNRQGMIRDAIQNLCRDHSFSKKLSDVITYMSHREKEFRLDNVEDVLKMGHCLKIPDGEILLKKFYDHHPFLPNRCYPDSADFSFLEWIAFEREYAAAAQCDAFLTQQLEEGIRLLTIDNVQFMEWPYFVEILPRLADAGVNHFVLCDVWVDKPMPVLDNATIHQREGRTSLFYEHWHEDVLEVEEILSNLLQDKENRVCIVGHLEYWLMNILRNHALTIHPAFSSTMSIPKKLIESGIIAPDEVRCNTCEWDFSHAPFFGSTSQQDMGTWQHHSIKGVPKGWSIADSIMNNKQMYHTRETYGELCDGILFFPIDKDSRWNRDPDLSLPAPTDFQKQPMQPMPL